MYSMCVGEKRKLVIPPDMAYGDRSMGVIKSGSTLGIHSPKFKGQVIDCSFRCGAYGDCRGSITSQKGRALKPIISMRYLYYYQNI